MTPTPGQPLSEADRGPAGAVMDALWPLLGGSHTSADLWHEINDAVSEALSPHAPVSRPAGEGEREAVARLMVDRTGVGTLGLSYDSSMAVARDLAAEIIALLSPAAPDAGGGERPHIFLDCDGVLADFDTYAEAYFGMNPREYEKRMGSEKFWRELEAKGDFYRNLPLMPDALALYEGVKHLNPTILTGCPRGNWAEAQKVAWAHEHFPGVPVITCRSPDKRAHAKPGDVLIDDWPQHRHRWVEHGGVFISHFDAETSLATLWAHYPALQPGGER